MHVIFRTDMKPKDELRAFYQAIAVLETLEVSGSGSSTSSPHSQSPLPSPTNKKRMSTSHGPHRDLLESSYAKMCGDFSFFYQQLQSSGWRTHMFLLNTTSWRIKLNDDA